MATFQRIEQQDFKGYDQASNTQTMEVGRFVRFALSTESTATDPVTVRLQDDFGYVEEGPNSKQPANAIYTVWGKRAGTTQLQAVNAAGQVLAFVKLVVEDKPIAATAGGTASSTPGADEGKSNTLVSKPSLMLAVEVAEPAEVKSQAAEKAFGHRDVKAYVSVECTLGTSHTFALTPDAAGVVRVPVEDETRGGMISFVRTEAGARSRCAVIWKDDYNGQRLTPGTRTKLTISTRLRFSVMSIVPCFLKWKTTTGEVEESLIDKLADAHVDDLWLVATIRPKQDGEDFTGVEWANSFNPIGSPREMYLKNLSGALAKRKVRLIIGYALVNLTKPPETWDDKDKVFHAYLAGWIRWVANASDEKLTAHADAIVKFFDDQQIPIGGVGFDLEVDGLNGTHAAQLGLLFARLSAKLASRNGIVGYANAPFLKDGKGTFPSSSKAQPYAIAAGAPNIVAYPMCYDDKNYTKRKDVEASIACALRATTDNAGGGLHASQVQFALWCEKMGTDTTTTWCEEVLRPNKIGLMVYTMPFAKTDAQGGTSVEGMHKASQKKQAEFFDRCKQWEAALNPGMGGIDEPGKPLQVPSCTPGGPTPFT